MCWTLKLPGVIFIRQRNTTFGFGPGSAASLLCDFRQVPSASWASAVAFCQISRVDRWSLRELGCTNILFFFFFNWLFFRAALDSQYKLGAKYRVSEYPFVPQMHTASPLCSRPTRGVHLLQSINLHWHAIITQKSLFMLHMLGVLTNVSAIIE